MNKAVYDTRFFVEFYYSTNQPFRRKIEQEKRRRDKYVSTVAIHEIYNITLAREGRETAKLRATLIPKDFQVIPVDEQIAQVSAELRYKYKLSMGDSMMAATAYTLKATCISDDPHFKQISEIETTWT